MLNNVFTVSMLMMLSCVLGQDPDINRNVSQLITSKGYPVENYEVRTSDGYILSLQRIPYGLKKDKNKEKPVVYLQHGVLADSTNFVLNFQHNSLGFVLADAGYDVWMGNSRGNVYSKNHIKYNTKQKEFWDFTFDEMAMYDLPATIDFVLSATNQKQLSYIGHSQGTTILFIMLSSLPAYNSKIKVGLALAPIAYESNMKGLLTLAAPFSKQLDMVTNVFGMHEFFPSDGFLSQGAETLCGTANKILCKNTAFLVTGPDSVQLNSTRLPVYIAHFPAGTSTKNMIHHAQGIQSGEFQNYDYGTVDNRKKYKSKSPPSYPLQKITAPIGLLYSLNDWLANPTDVALLKPKIKNLISYFQVPFPLWNHLDFVIGKDADRYLYPEVLRLLRRY